MELSSKTDEGLINSPATSLLVCNTTTAGTSPNNLRPGFYFWNGASWTKIKNRTNKKFLRNDVTATSTTLKDVTDLSFPITIGYTFKLNFTFFIPQALLLEVQDGC